MRSDVPCAEPARLVFAVGFPIASVCSLALAGAVRHGDGCDNGAELSRTPEQGLRLGGFLPSDQTERCKSNRTAPVPRRLPRTGVAKWRPRQQMVLAVGNAACSAYGGVSVRRGFVLSLASQEGVGFLLRNHL